MGRSVVARLAPNVRRVGQHARSRRRPTCGIPIPVINLGTLPRRYVARQRLCLGGTTGLLGQRRAGPALLRGRPSFRTVAAWRRWKATSCHGCWRTSRASPRPSNFAIRSPTAISSWRFDREGYSPKFLFNLGYKREHRIGTSIRKGTDPAVLDVHASSTLKLVRPEDFWVGDRPSGVRARGPKLDLKRP